MPAQGWFGVTGPVWTHICDTKRKAQKRRKVRKEPKPKPVKKDRKRIPAGRGKRKCRGPIAFDYTERNPGDAIVWANMNSRGIPTRKGIHTVHPVKKGTKKILQFWCNIQCNEKIRKSLLDGLETPQIFAGLINGLLLKEVLAYENGISNTNPKTEYTFAVASDLKVKDRHRFRAEPSDRAWKDLQPRILSALTKGILRRLDLNPQSICLRYNDGGFVMVHASNGRVWTHHDISPLNKEHDIDMRLFLKHNRHDEPESESIQKRKAYAIQQANLGREFTVIIQLQGPEEGGQTEFPNAK